MISLSFNLSPGIKTCLVQIDNFRKEILLTPLPLAKLLELQWKSGQGYLSSWTSLLPAGKATAGKLKASIDHIRQEGTGSSSSVVAASIAPLDGLLGTRAASSSDTIKVLEYLDTGSFHPILQAAISHLHFAPSPLAFAVPLLFIYRRGYDCQSVVCLDGFWPLNRDSYSSMLSQNQKTASITPWLEFYTQAAVYQYGVAHRLVLAQSSNVLTGTWTLSDRQKTILALLEPPGASITNRQVQKRFKISQVTASRDLAKLATLTMVYPHGRGRSVYYTRV